MKIVFAGTPEFTLPCLNALAASSHQIMGIYTQPDRPAGRGRRLQASAVKSWALEQQMPLYQPLNFKENEAIAPLKALKPDVMVVIAYGLILPSQVLAIPSLGCINVHASLLPRWRGASPIAHALLHGDEQTGITIMQMDKGMDTGPKLKEVACLIFKEDNAKTLHDRLAQLAVEPLLSTLADLEAGKAKPVLQNDAEATYASKIQKTDARIHWDKPSQAIFNQIRAFNPWPVAYTQMDSGMLRIYQAEVMDISFSAKPGTILSLDKKGILVATGNKALLVQTLQFAGGKILKVADWLNAKRPDLRPDFVFQ